MLLQWFVWLQPWLNVTGLVLGFVGILLLAREWSVALAAERREAEIAERDEMLRPRPGATRPSGPHQEVFDDMRARAKFRARAGRARSVWQERRGWYAAALWLIALGLALQIVGAAPVDALI